MGWFGQKKAVPRVPFPEGRIPGEGSLQFPSQYSSQKVIEPDQVKEAVGLDRPLSSMPRNQPESLKKPSLSPQVEMLPEEPADMPMVEGPLFIKMDVYQHILGEMDLLRTDFNQLREANNQLEQSEYNEEGNFTKLRRSMRSIHDNLLHVDKILFKSQGE